MMGIYEGPINKCEKDNWKSTLDLTDNASECMASIVSHLFAVRAKNGRAALAVELRLMIKGDHPLLQTEDAKKILLIILVEASENYLLKTFQEFQASEAKNK